MSLPIKASEQRKTGNYKCPIGVLLVIGDERCWFDSLYLFEMKKTKVGFPWLRDLLERVTGIEPA